MSKRSNESDVEYKARKKAKKEKKKAKKEKSQKQEQIETKAKEDGAVTASNDEPCWNSFSDAPFNKRFTMPDLPSQAPSRHVPGP